MDKLRKEYNDKFEKLQNEISELSQQHLYNLKEYLNYRRNTKQEIHDLKMSVFDIKHEKNRIKQKCNDRVEILKTNTNKLRKILRRNIKISQWIKNGNNEKTRRIK